MRTYRHVAGPLARGAAFLFLVAGGLAPARAVASAPAYETVQGLFTIQADGSGLALVREVRQPNGTNYDKLHASPDGKRIVFLRCIADLNGDRQCDAAEYLAKEVVVADLDGSNEVVVSRAQGGFNDYPNWAPDGRSVIFMHSAAPNVSAADLYRYELATGRLTNLTQTPLFMESDNYWNADGTLTVVRQALVNGSPTEPNQIVRVAIANPAAVTPLTHFTASLGRHCCGADPKDAPDGRTLAFARYVAPLGPGGDWDIVLRGLDGKEEVLGSGGGMDLWPMWHPDGRSLLWVRWDEPRHRSSIMIHERGSGTRAGRTHDMALVGKAIEFKVGDRPIVFTRANWPDWLRPAGDRLLFPATFLR